MRIKEGCLYVIQSEPHQEDKIIVIGYAKYIVTDFYKINRTISIGQSYRKMIVNNLCYTFINNLSTKTKDKINIIVII